MRFTVDRLDHLVITCRDVAKTSSWYQRVLGMEHEEYGRNRRCALKYGGQKINLRPVDMDPYVWVAAREPVAGSDDLCFVSPVSIPDVIGHLQDCGVAIEAGPVEREGALGPMMSVYCRDHDGYLVEIASYMRG